MYKVIVCGGRDYSDKQRVWTVLDKWYAAHPDLVVVQGHARGADELARNWAVHNSVPCVSYQANWAEHGTRAGPQRNHKMLTAGAALVIAFPGGKGTADMVRRALAADVVVVRIPETTEQE